MNAENKQTVTTRNAVSDSIEFSTVSVLGAVSDSVWFSSDLLIENAGTEEFHHCGDCTT